MVSDVRCEIPRSAIIFSMCDRYRFSRRKQIIEGHFDTIDVGNEFF